MSWSITISFEGSEPFTFGRGRPAPRNGRLWLSEINQPEADATPQEWAEFGDRLSWATGQVTRE